MVLNPAVEAFRLASLSGSHCVVVQVVKETQGIYMVSMYCQASHEIEPYLDQLRNIARILRDEELVIAIDSNARNPLWGYTVLKEKGERMEEFLEETGLICLNNGGIPTFSSARGESLIDLTIVTGGLQGRIKKWKVELEWTSSFHRAITGSIEVEERQRRRKAEQCRFSLKSADWSLYREELEEAKGPLMEFRLNGKYSTERYEGMVTRWITEAAEKSMKRGVKRASQVRWWCDELEELKRGVVEARRKLRRMREENEREAGRKEYRERRAAYKRRFKEEKERSWDKFADAQINQGP